LKGRVYLGEIRVDGRIILKCNLNEYGVEWILLAQDRGKLLAVVNTIMNFRVPLTF
jgi:hypothetical protein